MLYDARGKPLGPERETNKATVAGVSFAYSVLPAGAVGASYAASFVRPLVYEDRQHQKRDLVADKAEARVSRTVPARLRPILGLHEALHQQDLDHREIFPYELAAARELGVSEEYARFMASDGVYETARAAHATGGGCDTGWRQMTESLADHGAEAWFRKEDDAAGGYRLVPLAFPLRPAKPIVILP